jgi:hypothetical protein
VERSEGRRRWVSVVVRRADTPERILEGQFLAVVPDGHILDTKKERSR